MKLMHKLLAHNVGAVVQHLPNEAKEALQSHSHLDTICKL